MYVSSVEELKKENMRTVTQFAHSVCANEQRDKRREGKSGANAMSVYRRFVAVTTCAVAYGDFVAPYSRGTK